MKQVAANMAKIGFAAVVIIGTLLLAASCDHDARAERYRRLTEGCRMVGTIQSHFVGLDEMPAQEQWDCGGIMRTVNAVRN